MKVCIAEKPSVAKEIASVLGANSRRDGYYEGNGYQVTWTFGHFCTLYPPEDYNPDWKRWDLNTLPMLPKRFETKIMDDGGVKKQFKTIKELFKGADLVINCGDAGQEGELIQRWVIKQAEYTGPVQRLWISSLTTEAIKAGFEDLKTAEQFDNLYYAGSSRAIGDWLLGMNATRLYTLKYGGYKQVLSIGRVQTPTLAMLVNRHHEIESFQPEPYWELQTKYRDTIFNNTTGKYLKKEDGELALAQITGKDLEVTAIEKKDGKEYAPKLFDLTGLQVYCNNKFGFSADATLKMIQGLYEKKVVTYPRVDTTFLPNDMYPKVTGILKGLTNYSSLTEPLIGKKIRKSTKVFNDKKVTDHHAIIPTGEQKPLGADEQKVYDIIVRRFLAVFYPDCKVAKTQVNAEVDKIEFVAKGKVIIDEGWRAVFAQEKKNDDGEDSDGEDDEGLLPDFEKGERGPHEPSFAEKTTKAPNNYTEASLLRAMETAGKHVDNEELRDLMKANGIGRPSTRANIIETLFRRKYAERKKKLVVPTTMGIQLIGTIENQLLKSAELTGQWEKQLKEIEEGEYSASKFIKDMKLMVDQLVFEVRKESGKPRLSSTPVPVATPTKTPSAASSSNEILCPKCKKGTIVQGKTNYGCRQWKDGCDFRIPLSFMGKKISESQLSKLIKKGETSKLKGFNQGDSKVDGVIKLTDSFELTFVGGGSKLSAPKASESAMPPCPKCKKGVLIKGNSAYGCSEWKSGCDFRFSFDDIKSQAAGKKLTREVVLEIISG
jgi:DNA topoisomerase III